MAIYMTSKGEMDCVQCDTDGELITGDVPIPFKKGDWIVETESGKKVCAALEFNNVKQRFPKIVSE